MSAQTAFSGPSPTVLTTTDIIQLPHSLCKVIYNRKHRCLFGLKTFEGETLPPPANMYPRPSVVFRAHVPGVTCQLEPREEPIRDNLSEPLVCLPNGAMLIDTLSWDGLSHVRHLTSELKLGAAWLVAPKVSGDECMVVDVVALSNGLRAVLLRSDDLSTVRVYDAFGNSRGEFVPDPLAGGIHILVEGPHIGTVRALRRRGMENADPIDLCQTFAPVGDPKKNEWVCTERFEDAQLPLANRVIFGVTRCALPGGLVLYSITGLDTIDVCLPSFQTVAQWPLGPDAAALLRMGDDDVTYITDVLFVLDERVPRLAAVYGKGMCFASLQILLEWSIRQHCAIAGPGFRAVVRTVLHLAQRPDGEGAGASDVAGSGAQAIAGATAGGNNLNMWGYVPLELVEIILAITWKLSILG